MDWSIISAFSAHRQRHQYGNLELLWQLRNHFEIPPSEELFGEAAYKDLIYLMQVLRVFKQFQSVLVGSIVLSRLNKQRA